MARILVINDEEDLLEICRLVLEAGKSGPGPWLTKAQGYRLIPLEDQP